MYYLFIFFLSDFTFNICEGYVVGVKHIRSYFWKDTFIPHMYLYLFSFPEYTKLQYYNSSASIFQPFGFQLAIGGYCWNFPDNFISRYFCEHSDLRIIAAIDIKTNIIIAPIIRCKVV